MDTCHPPNQELIDNSTTKITMTSLEETHENSSPPPSRQNTLDKLHRLTHLLTTQRLDSLSSSHSDTPQSAMSTSECDTDDQGTSDQMEEEQGPNPRPLFSLSSSSSNSSSSSSSSSLSSSSASSKEFTLILEQDQDTSKIYVNCKSNHHTKQETESVQPLQRDFQNNNLPGQKEQRNFPDQKNTVATVNHEPSLVHSSPTSPSNGNPVNRTKVMLPVILNMPSTLLTLPYQHNGLNDENNNSNNNNNNNNNSNNNNDNGDEEGKEDLNDDEDEIVETNNKGQKVPLVNMHHSLSSDLKENEEETPLLSRDNKINFNIGELKPGVCSGNLLPLRSKPFSVLERIDDEEGEQENTHPMTQSTTVQTTEPIITSTTPSTSTHYNIISQSEHGNNVTSPTNYSTSHSLQPKQETSIRQHQQQTDKADEDKKQLQQLLTPEILPDKSSLNGKTYKSCIKKKDGANKLTLVPEISTINSDSVSTKQSTLGGIESVSDEEITLEEWKQTLIKSIASNSQGGRKKTMDDFRKRSSSVSIILGKKNANILDRHNNKRRGSSPLTRPVYDGPTLRFADSNEELGTLADIPGISLLEDDDVEEKSTENPGVKRRITRKRNVLRESVFLILSSLYGIMIVLIGAVLPITEIFISEDVNKSFEAFYVYLYGMSLLFLVYVYSYLLRRNRFKGDFIISTAWLRQLYRSWSKGENSENNHKHRVTKRIISLDMTNHHTGTFYLRLGVLGFGIGSMIHCGLLFGSYVSLSEKCSQALQMIKPLLHMLFAFFQLYFIFMNSKLCIHRYKRLARFGLMHMCATNICVWLRSIVVETIHVIRSHQHRSGHDVNQHDNGGHDHVITNSVPLNDGPDSIVSSSNNNNNNNNSYHDNNNGSHGYGFNLNADNVSWSLHQSTGHHGLNYAADQSSMDITNNDCGWSRMMQKAVEGAGPYLYPCTIEYSLMCACILYIMWKNVGQRPTNCLTSIDDEEFDENDNSRLHRMSVDCTSSSRGLFLGILVMVGTIISIIAFYMLVREPSLKHSAFVLTHVSETAVYLLTFFALIMASFKMKSLTFKNQQEAELEDILILISYTGLVAFIVFSLMASLIHGGSTYGVLNILSNIAMLIQATLQTIFMLAGDRMSAANHDQVRKKPGREYVTFILISNFAMWAINTFETQTPDHNPIQVDVYGIEAWAIFTHISVPLGIYYRFHSTVCMSNIWKNAWKIKKGP